MHGRAKKAKASSNSPSSSRCCCCSSSGSPSSAGRGGPGTFSPAQSARPLVSLSFRPQGGGWNGTAGTNRGNQILAAAGIAATVSVPDPGTTLYGDVTASVTYAFPVTLVGFI